MILTVSYIEVRGPQALWQAPRERAAGPGGCPALPAENGVISQVVSLYQLDLFYLQKELVSCDLLDQLAGVGCVELDPQVEGDRGDALDLLGDSLGGVQPVLGEGGR